MEIQGYEDKYFHQFRDPSRFIAFFTTPLTPAGLTIFSGDMPHNMPMRFPLFNSSAITHLHPNPSTLRTNDEINKFVATLLHNSLPVRIYQPTSSLHRMFEYLRGTSTLSLAGLQFKWLSSWNGLLS
ncbi:uncharacterized protein BYT42DRAFT_40810 [Radiomyces spectabilis]|uniref:uncharacterized protein n=1 Tax=Radiomyces spectabilis TaxID=64574 RepID=UPI00222128B6|nr:uncharacterized protein BYT42DRAFT_40810 [Radiomyces spectabilis]KAI8394328.1 hypothetical protein BYT42DRAFT_40810 [Radiomyces spectabilis]